MVKSGKNSIAFSYKMGNSFIHKMPALVKLFLIPSLNILVFNLGYQFALAFIVFQLILSLFLRFTFKEIFNDLKPVIYYSIFLYTSSFIAHLFTSSPREAFDKTFANSETIKMLLKLFCMMQSASILFKTSTSLQIREGIGKIESFIRKVLHLQSKNSFSNTLSLFICFIPMVYKNWEQAKKAWYARSGKNNIRMLSTLLPVFFSISIKQAYSLSKAINARKVK